MDNLPCIFFRIDILIEDVNSNCRGAWREALSDFW